uniref:Dihydropteridine reductase n=1 Tax=Timema douglasi TaxID=61478 RepID=A0A7R8VHC3_TIMDO|nr:unnamed protein product [Timema douglasi]
MAVVLGRVFIYGGKGALGAACVSHFKTQNWWVGSIDIKENDNADANILVKHEETWVEQEVSVLSQVGALLQGEKVDAVICVAGGWAGGNAASKAKYFASLEPVVNVLQSKSLNLLRCLRNIKLTPGGIITHCNDAEQVATELLQDVYKIAGEVGVELMLPRSVGKQHYPSFRVLEEIPSNSLLALFNLVKNSDLMWRQSVWSSTIAASIAANHLKDGGLISLPGAKPALGATPGKYMCSIV